MLITFSTWSNPLVEKELEEPVELDEMELEKYIEFVVREVRKGSKPWSLIKLQIVETWIQSLIYVLQGHHYDKPELWILGFYLV